CFFFSSRRRHTRCYRDWSSDVCSSDLENGGGLRQRLFGGTVRRNGTKGSTSQRTRLLPLLHRSKVYGPIGIGDIPFALAKPQARSEERRVGKEGRTGGRKGNE